MESRRASGESQVMRPRDGVVILGRLSLRIMDYERRVSKGCIM
jgi:hypothetical protein